MSDVSDRHGDLAAYAIGALTDEERAELDLALARDPALAAELEELRATVAMAADAAEPFDVPPNLAAGVRAAVAAAAEPGPRGNSDVPAEATTPVAVTRGRRGWTWPRRMAVAGGLALVLAGAVVAGVQIDEEGEPGPAGVLEVEGTLLAQGGDRAGRVEVRMLGIGREIAFRSGALPILPKGEYYELWFVGPGDRPGEPNRISAGTFHPDANGRSDVDFTAAVDPELYPVIEITAEPGDGNPKATGKVVARLDSSE